MSPGHSEGAPAKRPLVAADAATKQVHWQGTPISAARRRTRRDLLRRADELRRRGDLEAARVAIWLAS